MYCRQILEMDEMNTSYWLFLGYAQSKLEQFEEAIASFDQVIEIQEKWGISNTYPHLYSWLGEALHKVGQHKRENEIFKLGLQAMHFPGYILNQQSVCALARDDNERAAEYIQRYKAQRKAEGRSEALILNSIGYMYEDANRIEEALEALHKAQDLRGLYDPLLIGQIQTVEYALASTSQ